MIDFVARQIGVDGSEVGSYEWSGRTIEYHRAQIRAHLGFRVATVADQEEMTAWLAVNVAHAEQRPERVREELVRILTADGVTGRLLDVQWTTPHLRSLGAVDVSRSEYLVLLKSALELPQPAVFDRERNG